MIAPNRNLPTSAEVPLAGPRHIGQLLPQLLARYGIVISAAELAALAPVTRQTAAASFKREPTPPRRAKLSSRGLRGKPLARGISTPRKMVQLPLFQPVDYAAVSQVAAS
jgi:hypothetical protein